MNREKKERKILKPMGTIKKTIYTKESRPSRDERSIQRQYGNQADELAAMLGGVSWFGKAKRKKFQDRETKYLLSLLKKK
jgi:hypothetical protein